MTTTTNLTIIVTTKVIVVFCFIFFLHYWYKKKNGIVPKALYWFLGIFFTFVIPQTIFEWILKSIFSQGNRIYSQKDLTSFASFLALIFYVSIGLKFFRSKKRA